MSNNTARLAREWAQFELDNAGEFSNKGRIAAAEHILATTDPLTMADADWDDEEHRLAGATTPEGTEVVMMWHDADETNQIICLNSAWEPDRLTPNGKKYELREVGATEQPEHPATLVTEQDYENAPVGTIVDIEGNVAVRGWAGWYPVNFLGTRQPEFMSRQGEGDVIRWGGWSK